MRKQLSTRKFRAVGVIWALLLVITMIFTTACSSGNSPAGDSNANPPTERMAAQQVDIPSQAQLHVEDMSDPGNGQFANVVSWELSETEAELADVILEYSADGGASWTPVDVKTSDSRYDHINLSPATSYTYRLEVTYDVNGVFETVVSESDTVTTPDKPVKPVITITKQPTGATRYVGQGEPLILLAEADVEGTELSYQWFIRPLSEEGQFVEIVEEDAKSSTYTHKAGLGEGSYWYRCEVSASGADTVTSDVVLVKVVKRPVAPPAQQAPPSGGGDAGGGGGTPAPPSNGGGSAPPANVTSWVTITTIPFEYGTITVDEQYIDGVPIGYYACWIPGSLGRPGDEEYNNMLLAAASAVCSYGPVFFNTAY